MTGTSFFSVEKIGSGRSGGTTQAESRIYNERLVVTLVRRHGQLAKTDLTRLTGLAPQTITTIVNRAAEAGLLRRLEPMRGKLGQPSVPYALNPDAAFSFGLKIDHHSADVALINFTGEVVAFERAEFVHPGPEDVMAFARSAIERLRAAHPSVLEERIAGLGIASPFHPGSLGEDAVLPQPRIQAWRKIDIRAELDRVFDWPVFLHNDGTMAVAAELMFGAGAFLADFLHAYIGHCVGGGLALDHHLHPGRNKLAGALGDMPVPAAGHGNEPTVPLSRLASLRALADRLNGADDGRIWSSPDDWGDLGPPLQDWIEAASGGLAHVVMNAVALLDIDNVVIDGAMPKEVRKEIAKATRRKLARSLAGRPQPFSVLEGAFGHLGPAIGGASIPLLVKYSNDRDVLFKD
ncbi:ROK family transcriptional regulator [Nordella sp. HKS 07]|uniref:ROK family transcriptional regulator n=1 Tax=Nordella sp. HKS 07 TaxID=2712222 RepID=UPI0013E18E13|nr:ROK family transcriptional regulator [Nordella sp. HKS 07]QIG51699.1 ROK family transcriptional regulator [Nordella sp. HKS 07]